MLGGQRRFHGIERDRKRIEIRRINRLPASRDLGTRRREKPVRGRDIVVHHGSIELLKKA